MHLTDLHADCGIHGNDSGWAWRAKHAACFSPGSPWSWSSDGDFDPDLSTEAGSGGSDTDTLSLPASPTASEELLFSIFPGVPPGWATHLSTTPTGWGPSREDLGAGGSAAAREAMLQRARQERRPLKVRMPAGGEHLERLPAHVDVTQPLKKRLPFGAAFSMVEGERELMEPLKVALDGPKLGCPVPSPAVAPR